jgi:hypothetical protein
MKNKTKPTEGYGVLSSLEGEGKEVKSAEEFLSTKETEENLKLFAKRVSSDWKLTDPGKPSRMLSFADFQKAIAEKHPQKADLLAKKQDTGKLPE